MHALRARIDDPQLAEWLASAGLDKSVTPLLRQIRSANADLEAKKLDSSEIDAAWSEMLKTPSDDDADEWVPLNAEETAFADSLDDLLTQIRGDNPAIKERGRVRLRELLASKSDQITDMWGKEELARLTAVASGLGMRARRQTGEPGRDELLASDSRVVEREIEFRKNRASTAQAEKRMGAKVDRWFK